MGRPSHVVPPSGGLLPSSTRHSTLDTRHSREAGERRRDVRPEWPMARPDHGRRRTEDLFSPKGWHRIAQGNALGTGRVKGASPVGAASARAGGGYLALSGLEGGAPRVPRALPWAILSRPFWAPELTWRRDHSTPARPSSLVPRPSAGVSRRGSRGEQRKQRGRGQEGGTTDEH